ncbi:MAG: 1-acyl-sn-glycerol-3-phosphate acyltransferase [Planctomycetia bacterium]|nr:1-acyl-sn-glycerol-3-phosphate acyltransferase [Planctomycetia bacterium]NCF98557.1 1-acyl-sn-glycerol-3-phosphate acyltransferase [Planctomycetia bacterium]
MDPGDKPIYRLIRGTAWFFCKILFRHRVRGHENIPKEGPFLLAVNHSSNLDPILAGTSVKRPMAYMARSTLFSPAPMGWIMRNVNALPVEREGLGIAGFRAILDHLEAGGGALIFPEGTRSADGRLKRFKGGIVRLANLAQVPVVPAYISGAARAMRRGNRLPRPLNTEITFGECIDKEVFSEEDNGLEVLRKAIEDLVQDDHRLPPI